MPILAEMKFENLRFTNLINVVNVITTNKKIDIYVINSLLLELLKIFFKKFIYPIESISSGFKRSVRNGIIDAIDKTSKNPFNIIDKSNIKIWNLRFLEKTSHKFLIK